MSVKSLIGPIKSLKKFRNKGVAIAGLCIVACKAPLLLVLFGFGGLGATASILELTPIMQTIGVTASLLGIAAITVFFAHKVYRRKKS